VLTVIDDDGQGSDADAVWQRSGIQELRGCVQLLDGRSPVGSSEGAGTTLVIEKPAG
jgi:signal transduction histidine kinase